MRNLLFASYRALPQQLRFIRLILAITSPHMAQTCHSERSSRRLFFLFAPANVAAPRSRGISLRLIAKPSRAVAPSVTHHFRFPFPRHRHYHGHAPEAPETTVAHHSRRHIAAHRPKIPRGKLLQVLGVWFGIAAAVGNTIAAGIVRTPGDIAKILPNPWLFLGVWVIGGLYALFGASSMAELGAAIPRSGGQYNFSRRAIGDYAGFIVGWSDWLSSCGTLAAVAIVIGEYSGKLITSLAGTEKTIAVAVIVGFGILQWSAESAGAAALN